MVACILLFQSLHQISNLSWVNGTQGLGAFLCPLLWVLFIEEYYT